MRHLFDSRELWLSGKDHTGQGYRSLKICVIGHSYSILKLRGESECEAEKELCLIIILLLCCTTQ